MSILIRGMEMPKACRECPLETDYGTCGYYSLYVEAGHESDCEKRRDDCPLISVPPHGRLIDADALAKDYDGFPVRIDPWVWNELSHAPTVIEAEEAEE